MGGAVSTGVDNDDLVDKLKAANYIKTPLVERIFRAVDRGDYFTSDHRDQAYRDNAWKNGNLHLSAPCIYAKVMESLQLDLGHSFLNLGSGTGYLSTMAGLIIGPYGINHGVELHADVLTYAHERLEDFKKASALDAFSFCDPVFVQGNCLCLPPEVRLYDRVYCGASCPEKLEHYMKGLIKEGGVLVMPLNDQLVKITRTGPATWETSSLLPVSFSSLVMPDVSYPPASVSLPEVELLDLQDMCRQEVRSIMRANIDIEHPELATAANRPVPKRQSRCPRQQFPGVFVPYMPVDFYESDDEPVLMSDDNLEGNQLATVLEFANRLHGPRLVDRELPILRRRNPQVEDDENDGDAEEEVEEDSSSDTDSSDSDKVEMDLNKDGKRDHKTEKSGAARTITPPLTRKLFFKNRKVRKEAEEIKEKTKDNSSAQGNGEASSASSLPQSDPIPMTSTPVLPVKSNKKREKFDSGVGDEIENGKGPSSDDGEEGDVEMDIDSTDSAISDGSPSRSRLRNRTRTKVTRLLDPDDPDCPCGGNCYDPWEEKKEEEEEEGKEDRESQSSVPSESYSMYMREKIGALPLPQALKLYLNYYREL